MAHRELHVAACLQLASRGELIEIFGEIVSPGRIAVPLEYRNLRTYSRLTHAYFFRAGSGLTRWADSVNAVQMGRPWP